MKKFTKSVLFLLLVSIFLGASLFVGCRNPFMPDAPVDAMIPTISVQPKDSTVLSDAKYTVSVSATVTDGGTLSYQWYEANDEKSEGVLIEGETKSSLQSTYILQNNETEKIFYYYVVVTNTNNNATGTKSATVTSTRAKVTVNNKTNAALPVITEQPKQAEVLNTKEFTVSVVATNDNKGTLSYKWYKTDTVDGEGSLIEGANSASYTTSIILEDDETTKDFYFYVEITNTYNEATGNKIATVISDRAKITVVKINAQAPVIDIQPKSYNGKKPDTAIELSVAATISDDGDLTYQWYKDNEVISGATSATYQIPDAELEGTSYYYCKVTNSITDNGDGGMKVSSVNSDVVCIYIEKEAPKPDVNPEDQNGSYFPDSGIYSAVDLNGEEAGYGWDTQTWNLGANVNGGDVEFAVYSKNATRLMLEIYEEKWGVDASYYYLMEKGSDDVWRAKIAGIGDGTLYAFRAWGPNWPYSEEWDRGNSSAGFISDYDSAGNRFNPNKVLFDPYAKEISHDKSHPDVLGMVTGATGSEGESNPSVIYSTGATNKVNGNPSRNFDTGKYAPKAVVIDDSTNYGTKPQIPQEKAIIYEAHARGITKHSSSANLSTILNGIEGFENVVDIPAEYQGTYKGAGMLAPYLKALGVNTIELLPVHESDNDCNPDDNPGGNYWAYMTYGYFAPDRRYSSDKSLGGPTKEFKEMVAAFHDVGMEVYLDVVFNHSGEGGPWYGKTDNYNTAELTFMRGLDCSEYYCLTPGDVGDHWQSTGCGNNLQCDNPVVRKLILDSLTYWIDEMGVDGYRFDLAPVLSREFDGTDWKPNTSSKLLKDISSLGATKNAEMIAEAWDCNPDGYLVGQFPDGWGEWNGRYRDAMRNFVGNGNWGSVGDFINGDYANFNDQGGPHKTVNFIVAHDGFTLADLCSYAGKGNAQNGTLTWPFGPSDGGNGDDNSLGFVDWTSEATQKASKRQANRNYIAIQMMSRGVPMIVWGDEFCRTQNGNNNPYNIDSVATWSNYNMINTDSPHKVATGGDGEYHNNFGTFGNDAGVNGNFMFMNYMLKLKASEPALNVSSYDLPYEFSSPDGQDSWLGAACIHIKGSTTTDGSDYLLCMNMKAGETSFTVPAAASGKEWVRIVDTQSYFETDFNCWKDDEATVISGSYGVAPWSVVILKQVDAGTGYTPPAPEGSGNYIYLKPNSNWTQDNARFAAYFFGNGDTWVSMTDSDSDGIYECEIPAGYPNVIFCRMNPAITENGWTEGSPLWNQSNDLTIPTDGKNLYTVAAGVWSKGEGSWSTK